VEVSHVKIQTSPVVRYNATHWRLVCPCLADISAFEERRTFCPQVSLETEFVVRIVPANALEVIFVFLSFQGGNHIRRGADERLGCLLGLVLILIAMPEEYFDDGSRVKPGWVYAASGACKLGDRRGEIFSL
jgi:hypothetical protein